MENPKVKILVVDDDPAIMEFISLVLGFEGYEVHGVTDLDEFEDAVEKHQPDLVILDIIMPDTNGLVLLSRLRSKGKTPVIMLTTSRRSEDAVLSLRLGADDYILIKPFDVDELVVRVETVLRRHRRTNEPTTDQPSQS